MVSITRPVGGRVPNPNREEVRAIQRLLNQHRKPPLHKIAEDGIEGPETRGAIVEFQRRVVGMQRPDGVVDPNGRTLAALNRGANNSTTPPNNNQNETGSGGTAGNYGTFSHPNADSVTLTYGPNAVRLNAKAAHLLKSILASVGLSSARLTSTLRTYHDQARITMTQTLPNRGRSTVSTWYGADVLEACLRYQPNIQAFADWWQERDRKRGRVSSLHLSNLAMDVVPGGDRVKFKNKVQELVPVAGSGVRRIIPKGVMNEPVDHVEFTFPVTG